MSTYKEIVTMWQGFNITTQADLEQQLHNFKILFAYHSGKIENDEINYHDTREVFEHGRMSRYQGNPRTLFEAHNQKMCYLFLLKSFETKTPLTLKLIKEVHRILTEGTYDERRYIEKGERPGEFKRGDYVTGIHEVGSSPKAVADDLQSLLDEITGIAPKITTENILKIATYFHVRFEFIHPFADGNGRTGRTLLNYLLMINNHPPFIIYEEDRHAYYQGLQVYDEDENLDLLQHFFMQQLEKTWQKKLDMFKQKLPSQYKTLNEIL